MRHILLALLIALLPLRGWVGDAMAITLVSPAAAQELVAELPDCMEHSAAVHSAIHAPPADHSDSHVHHGGPNPHHASGEDEPSHAHSSCDVCNGPAMALGWPTGVALPAPPALAITLSVRFASTVLPQGVKPPIS